MKCNTLNFAGKECCHGRKVQAIEYGRTECVICGAAAGLKRPPSTVSREIARNAGRQGFRYSVTLAQNMSAVRRFHRPSKFKRNPHLWPQIIEGLRKNFSPEQISGRLRRMHPDDPDRHVSHETIYASIYAQPRGYLRTELIKHLRHAHVTRRPRSQGKDRRGTWPEMTLIAERPDEVEGRAVPGHWEGDLIIGKQKPKSAVGSIVERTSRYLILVQVEKASAPVVANGFTSQMQNIPPLLRKSLTYDRGTEMAWHRQIEQALDLTVYFADPRSPWQRGTNENTNGLVRQYLPKGTDLSGYTQDDLNAIAKELNERPRKCLDYQTP
ncbi:MAG: IS30 family transposase, partial [Alphaproteobacteria bacterium]